MARKQSKGNEGAGASRAVRLLRSSRSLHGAAALVLLVLVVFSATTGVLLSWKKNVDALQPPTRDGTVAELRDFLPLHRLSATAVDALGTHLESDDPDRLLPERLDVRPDDGIVKVLFPGAWEVQVDGGTATVLSIARRHSDWIESIHDGSIINDAFKLLSMNVLGLGLLALAASGFWMWYGPKRLRRRRAERRPERPESDREMRRGA